MAERKTFELTDLEIVSVGLVDRPAVRDATFLLVKQEALADAIVSRLSALVDAVNALRPQARELARETEDLMASLSRLDASTRPAWTDPVPQWARTARLV